MRFYVHCFSCNTPNSGQRRNVDVGQVMILNCSKCNARLSAQIGRENLMPPPAPTKITAPVYKAVKAPAVPPVVALPPLPDSPGEPRLRVNWGKVSQKINYIAADRDGRVFGYQYEPVQCDGFWGAGELLGMFGGTKERDPGFVDTMPTLYIDPFCLWWRRSLIVRPGHALTKIQCQTVDKEPVYQDEDEVVSPDDMHRRIRNRKNHLPKGYEDDES